MKTFFSQFYFCLSLDLTFKDQDIRVASRCLWDIEKDNSVSVVYKNSSIYAVATVFAIYFE